MRLLNLEEKIRFFILLIIVSVLLTVSLVEKSNKREEPIEEKVETVQEKCETIKEEIKETKTVEFIEVKEPELDSLGEFKLTAYCSCSSCCGIWNENRPNGIVYGAIGEELSENYSIAVDPNVIPYGTEVIINGHTYKAQDCGGAIDGHEIDIYMTNHDDALKFGVQYAEVFVKSN